ncbi:putative sensor domain DACNV-containing protein [Desulfopila inferna]|uniref:putative sensor domain DACNV-containing protein n=1 Tax=Desulfopila inferna TaxID=468528 RepID=UPI0019662741|nr:hypothetical protein [Desulfopila inferna]MBM9604669.1 hypothetical protein [Desulfopila inferna]
MGVHEQAVFILPGSIMGTSAFQLSEHFIDQLWQKIAGRQQDKDEADASIFHSVFLSGNIPTKEHLTSIIEVSYWASFATEEGNSVTASLILREAEHTPDTFCFDTPLDFSDRTLVKLGPALENPKTDIGVWPDESGFLRIWGFTSARHELIKPDFWVQILGPGLILVLYSGRSLAAVTGNQAVFLDQNVAMQSLMPKISAQAKTSDLRLLNLLRYNALLKIAQQMRAHGRGGTVLVVPENNNWKPSIKSPIKYTGGANFLDADIMPGPALANDSPGLDQISHLIDEMSLPQQKDWIGSWQQVQQQCNRIARLTAVDGALVMTFDRFVYCFGAKITPLNLMVSSSQLRLVNPFEDYTEGLGRFSSLSGTRHQSAAQFAHDQPGSIAIAASQDGNVTFFTRDSQSDTTIALQHAELILLHEGLVGSLWNLSIFTELGWFAREEDGKKGKNYLSAVISWMKTTLQRE